MKTVTLNEALEMIKNERLYLGFVDNQYNVVDVYSIYEGSHVEDVCAIVRSDENIKNVENTENTEGDLK